MKHFFQQIAFLFLLFCAAQCSAQTEKEDPIDIAYHACIGKDTSYSNICNCAFTAYGKWNNEMDNAYKKVLKMLKKEKDEIAFKASQAQWIVYRDAEFSSYDNMFNLPNNYWARVRQEDRIAMVRDRALQFRKYILELKKRYQ